jgi:DNA-binding ferritin-like protein
MVKTIKNKVRSKGTTLRKHTNNYSHENIIKMFLVMLNTVKLYHWHTYSYPQHKATDELYENLNDSIDNFVEIMLGKKGTRFDLNKSKSLPLMDYTNINDFKKDIERYKQYLINMNNNTIQSNTDLMNTRDEILGHLNKFTYLLTFK